VLVCVKKKTSTRRNLLDCLKFIYVGEEYFERVIVYKRFFLSAYKLVKAEKQVCKSANVVDMHMRDKDRAHSFKINSDFGCRKGAVLTRIEEVVSVGYLKEN
jgi:hypothetical protein